MEIASLADLLRNCGPGGLSSLGPTTRGKGDPMSDTPETAPGRRWYHLRPEPRRRTDLMGFSSTLWMAVGWLIVIVVIVFPFPWWW